MKHEFKVKHNKDQTVYTLESASVGATSTAGGATVTKALGGVRSRAGDNLLAQEADTVKVPVKQKPRQGALRTQTGAGAHRDKKKEQKQGKEKHRKPYMENFDSPEYNDEAGMARSNLLTMARAVTGLLKTIDDNDNLPEWCQEKIAKAEMMLVTVWDYLQSQKDQGIDPEQNMEEGAEFGSKYAEQLAQQVFNHDSNIEDENQVLDLGYNIAKNELGSRAKGIFRDEDFPSDFVSAYFYLQKQGVAEGKDMCHVCGQTPCNCTSINEYEAKLKEMLDLKLAEKIPPNASVDYYIQDFSKSNAPQFRGKTKEKRKEMAIAAYYGSKQPKKKKKK